MLADFVRGAGLLVRGWLICARNPRLFWLGLIPVAVTAVLFLLAFGVLLFFLADLASVVTWFAADWSAGARTTVEVLAAVGLVGVAFLLGVVTFTAVTLAVGDPFYQRISLWVEQRCGGVPGEVEVGFWRSLRQSLGDSARLVSLTAAIGLGLFLLGLVPAVGQIVAPVLGATVAGWFLALELVAIPFDRRGLRLRDRRAALRAHRPTALGFGVAVFGCFLVPGGAILMMPAAVAGGALLARRALGAPVAAFTATGGSAGGQAMATG